MNKTIKAIKEEVRQERIKELNDLITKEAILAINRLKKDR